MVKNILIHVEDSVHKKYVKIKGDLAWEDVLEIGIDYITHNNN